jgi:hypothetical protein
MRGEIPRTLSFSKTTEARNRSWKYEVLGPGNFTVPVFFLDADLPVPFHSPGKKKVIFHETRKFTSSSYPPLA